MKAMTEPRLVACPQCGKPVEWTPRSRFRPFCSERCKMIDLGNWLGEQYRVPGGPANGESNSDDGPSEN